MPDRDPDHWFEANADRVADFVRGGPALGRRHFLQAMLAGAGVVAVTPLLGRLQAYAASPVGARDGILVHLTLGGGNDALNTLAPVDDGLYRSLRPTLALPNDPAVLPRLPGNPALALHPALTNLRARYSQGQVAFVRGVGQRPTNFSHFHSMGAWMQGWTGSPVPSGWLGRYLDGLPNASEEPLHAVTLDSTVGLHLTGTRTAATSLRSAFGGYGTSEKALRQREYQALRNTTAAPLDGLAGQYARIAATMLDVPGTLAAPHGDPGANVYADGLPAGGIERHLALCARLVNADLGIRVLNASHGSYDTHSQQAGTHANRLGELDRAIAGFFATLDPRFADRVTILVHSEFSRRPRENDSRGTDHGAAGLVMLIGQRVKGGLYGDDARLDALEDDNLRYAVDYRSIYATVLEDWLGVDSVPILNGRYEKLPALGSPGDSATPIASTPAPLIAAPKPTPTTAAPTPTAKPTPTTAAPTTTTAKPTTTTAKPTTTTARTLPEPPDVRADHRTRRLKERWLSQRRKAGR